MYSVIFDMDGTLLDTQQIYVTAWELFGRELGFPGWGSYLPMVCGMNEAGWMAFLEERHPSVDLEQFKNKVYSYVRAHQKPAFKKGAKELLDFLKEKGVPMAVASGSDTEDVLAYMGALGATDYFKAIVGGDMVNRGKPAPDIYALAAAKIGADPKECYAFEDSANGIRSAHAAGMKCFGVPDLAPLTQVKDLMFAEISDLSQAIAYLEGEA